MRVFEFSGGKDSIAVLMLLKDRLHEITVVWADSGDAFPETHAQMEKIKSLCPNFLIVKGNQPEVIKKYGFPVDILPTRNHEQISNLTQQDRPKLQIFIDCCVRSFLEPIHKAVLALGATEIIRGQKNSDRQKSPVRSGDVIDGVLYTFPIQDWTDEQVMDFIKDSDLLPKHYADANTSLDCMHCTAYLEDNQWKLPYLQKHYPLIAIDVKNRMFLIRNEIERDLVHLNRLLEN